VTLVAAVAIVLIPSLASSVTLPDLEGHDDIFGRYGPGGDCSKQPLVTVDASGIAIEAAGKREKTTGPELALEFFGPQYQGIAKVIFPFTNAHGYPVLMTFNADEKPGRLTVDANDEGLPGEPPLSPLNAALVKGSPYQRCK
jgi:hypothetical protein